GELEGEARAAAFLALVTANFGLVVVNRSYGASIAAALGRSNRAFWRMLAATAALLSAALLVPPLRELFHFERLDAPVIAAALGLGIAVLAVLETAKALGLAGVAARHAKAVDQL
ncbi:MAG TPA: cation-translocating P-type ATPase C-terminal domain-containing protein, partial [Stellaceae bacterium]|nr:cation-translocating P-type ATPase C-terminal domain-containing protein [Stellaceae bacterium]